MMYYVHFEEILIVPLQKVMNEIKEEKIIPLTWQEAYIMLISKESSNATLSRPYRLISLLNTVQNH